jgi:hypothetical protein
VEDGTFRLLAAPAAAEFDVLADARVEHGHRSILLGNISMLRNPRPSV